MKKSKANNVLRQIADGNLSSRGKKTGATFCTYCICKSCTGFGCPWVNKFWRYSTQGYKFRSERCRICFERDLEMIHDCDFYTNHRRKRFFVKRSWIRKETKTDIILKEIIELKRKLDEKKD